MKHHEQIIINLTYVWKEDYYLIESPTHPELNSQGDSLEDARVQAADALQELFGDDGEYYNGRVK